MRTMNEEGRKALTNGYKAEPYSNKPKKHGWKVWPEDWEQQKADNVAEVKALREKMIRNCGTRRGF